MPKRGQGLRPITMNLHIDDLRRIRGLALRERIPYQQLIRRIVHEWIEHKEQEAGRTKIV